MAQPRVEIVFKDKEKKWVDIRSTYAAVIKGLDEAHDKIEQMAEQYDRMYQTTGFARQYLQLFMRYVTLIEDTVPVREDDLEDFSNRI